MKSLKSLDVIARDILEAARKDENQVLKILKAREEAIRTEERQRTKAKTVKGVLSFLKQESGKVSPFAQAGIQRAADRIQEAFKD